MYRVGHKEHINNHKLVAARVVELQRRGSCLHKIPREWVLMRISALSMMNVYEEDLDDFPVENKERPAESMVGAYRAELLDQWVVEIGIATKISPLY